MLTGKLVRARQVRERLIPWYINPDDAELLHLADQLIAIFQSQVSFTRGELDAEVDELIGDLPSPILHQGLAKLLEDRCDFECLPGQPPEELRESAFRTAVAQRLKQGSFDRAEVLRQVAKERGLEVDAVEAGLFADLKSEQRLVRFQETTATRLLERYNVALAQAVLLRSSQVEVQIQGESPQRYRQLFRQIKFHRLICTVEAIRRDAYRLRLDGPLSLFSATQKYGLQLAFFLPSLLLCEHFTLEAKVYWGPQRQQCKFIVSSQDGLVSHVAETGMYQPPEVGMFVELFRKKIEDWEISEATEIVPMGRHFWVPDYVLVHRPTGQSVLLDVLGYWRRSGLATHLQRLKQHVDRPVLVALSEQLHVEEAELAELPAEVLRFRNLPLAEEVAKRAHRLLFPKGSSGSK